MIEPYSSCIAAVEINLLSIGLKKISDNDMVINYSDRTSRLRFMTERHYHPSVAVVLINSDNCEYEIGLLQKCMDAENYEIGVGALNTIRSQIEQAGVEGDIAKMKELTRAHVLLTVTQVEIFLIYYWHEISPMNVTIKQKYLVAEKLSLKRFGL